MRHSPDGHIPRSDLWTDPARTFQDWWPLVLLTPFYFALTFLRLGVSPPCKSTRLTLVAPS
jgi:hypothetical protein